jgi:GNAT superfamily N-acetyltransferase
MSRIVKILTSQFRERSLREFLALVLGSVYRSDPILIFGLKAEDMLPREEPSKGDATLRKGNIEELPIFRSLIHPVPWELQVHEYDGVEDFFVAVQDGTLQHITWVYSSPHRNRLLRLGPGEAEFKFSLTLPDYRGRGLQPRVYTAIAHALSQEGYRRFFACVHEENLPSIRGMEKAGFRRVGHLRLRRILGIQTSRKVSTSEI